MNNYSSFCFGAIRFLVRGTILSSLTILLFAACNASKKTQLTPIDASLKQQTASFLRTKLTENHIDAEWLDAKAKIHYEDDLQTQNVTATIRLKKDSVIWINIKRLSVEAARILIDKDSVYIINRLEKEYYVKRLDYIEQEFNLPANFDALQTIILGNPYFFDKQEYISTIQNAQYRLSGGEGSNLLSDYWLNGTSYFLEQMTFLDLRNDRKVVAALEDYQILEQNSSFSFQRNFQVQSPKTGLVKVNIKFLKVERNLPVEMPFSISDRYKRVDQ